MQVVMVGRRTDNSIGVLISSARACVTLAGMYPGRFVSQARSPSAKIQAPFGPFFSLRSLYRIKGHVDGPTKDPSRHLASSHTEFGTHGPIISWMVLEFHPSRFIPGSRM